jgi:hypothetical protein
MARPLKYNEETVTVTFRMPLSLKKEISDYVDDRLKKFISGNVLSVEVKPIGKANIEVSNIDGNGNKEWINVSAKPKNLIKEYKDTLPELKTDNLSHECPNCRYTTIKSSGLRLRISRCQECKDKKI